MDEPTRQQRIDAADARCRRVRDMRHRQALAFDRYREAVEGMDGLKAVAYRESVKGGGQSHGDDALTALLDSAAYRLDRYVQMLGMFENELDEFDAILARMENQAYARILSLRYVGDWDWRDIASEVPYSYNHICTYAREAALLQFYDAMFGVIRCSPPDKV